jgi:hypothetical protein
MNRRVALSVSRSLLIHFLRQPFDLFKAEDLLIDKADKELLGRSCAQLVDDVTHGTRGDTLRSNLGAIQKRVPINAMCQVPAFFQTPQQRPNAGVFERMFPGEMLSDPVGGYRPTTPNEIEDSLMKDS